MPEENPTVNNYVPNTCSIWHWLAAFCISFLTMVFAARCIDFLPFTILRINSLLKMLLPYAVAFGVMVICLKKICHTPVRDFIFGLYGKLNVKTLFTLAGLYLLGILISFLFTDESLHLNQIEPNVILMNTILCVLLGWMQATLEEFWFRGLFIRYVGKGSCGLTLKLILAGCLSSLVFMCFHFSNLAFSAQNGVWQQICLALSYFLGGFFFYLLDLCFGDLTPGLVLHWFNNMLAFTLFSSSNGTTTGVQSLTGVILNFLPVFLYVIILAWRKKLPCQQNRAIF